MIGRDILSHINLLLKEFPAIAVLGARQVGKTTLATRIAAGMKKKVVHIDLERLSDRRRIADPEIFFEDNRRHLVVLDEIQTMPELFAALRPEIDAFRRAGRFLLTGSASPELVKG